AVEVGSVELVQTGALEAFDDGVVVRAARRREGVLDAQLGAGGLEVAADELRAAVGQHPGQLDVDRGERGLELVQKRGRGVVGLLAADEPGHGPAGRYIDRGELPDRADTLEPADVVRRRRCPARPADRAWRRTGRTRTGPAWRRR